MKLGLYKTLLAFGSVLVNQRSFKKYCYFCIIAESAVYLFFNPSLVYHGYDLARYYEELTFYGQLSLRQLIGLEPILIGNGLFEGHFNNYPLFNFYMYLFSKTGYEKLLPFVTGIICRSMELSSIFHYTDKKDIILRRHQRLLFLGSFFLMHSILEAAGIRNPIAISLCIWALIHDLVLKEKRVLCILAYLAACMFHSMAYIIVALRAVMLLFNRLSRTYYYLLLFFAIVLITIINSFPTLLVSIGNALNLPTTILYVISKSTTYRRDLEQYPVWQLFMYGYTYISVWLIARSQVKEKASELGELYRFINIYLLLIFVNVNVTSLFGRSRMLIYPLSMLFLLNSLPERADDRLGVFRIRDSKPIVDIAGIALYVSSVMLIFSFDVLVSYRGMESYITF